MKLGTATVIRADARSLPLPDNSVDIVVTSPPYFALRSYQDGGEHYAGQIGSEPTPAEFVAALLEVTAECVRVLKPSGSLWVNLGDKYSATSSPGPQSRKSTMTGGRHKGVDDVLPRRISPGAPPKSLMGIPWRYALRCIDDLGLILRAEVIWSKPNGLPESVTDRVRRSHEQWFHFTLSPRYFSAVDEVREQYAPETTARYAYGFKPASAVAAGQSANAPTRADGGGPSATNPLGKLPGSVWTDAEPGDSLVRSVLSAVSAGALTIEEGERLLWNGARSSGQRSRSTTRATAGTGLDRRSPQGTGRSTSPAVESSGHTESSTNSSPDPSATDSPSTTSAETERASTPTTSSPSPSPRTSDEHTPSGQPASADTTSPTPTSRPLGTDAPTDDANSASVWVVPTEPLRVPEHLGVDHFAAFPTSFPKRIIQGWSPAGVCVACGEGRRPVTVAEYDNEGRTTNGPQSIAQRHESIGFNARAVRTTLITGYACACPEPTADTTPAVVLDPFGGTGTTVMVAKALGRHGISVDMSADYCRLAEWRTSDPAQLAKVLGLAKPDVQPAEQLGLFDLDGEAS